MYKTKIYVMFLSSGICHRGSWDTTDIKQKVMMNEEILKELEKKMRRSRAYNNTSRGTIL